MNCFAVTCIYYRCSYQLLNSLFEIHSPQRSSNRVAKRQRNRNKGYHFENKRRHTKAALLAPSIP